MNRKARVFGDIAIPKLSSIFVYVTNGYIIYGYSIRARVFDAIACGYVTRVFDAIAFGYATATLNRIARDYDAIAIPNRNGVIFCGCATPNRIARDFDAIAIPSRNGSISYG